MHLHLTESSAFSDSNLLSGWISYLRTGYRDSLVNESHRLRGCHPTASPSDAPQRISPGHCAHLSMCHPSSR
ncbi:hypothetical protein CK516_34260 [Nostoc sp. 'Peltigera malacea cyanobiont' DB3992]|nr:hypothetical protein CK516_34260 [Nostoc sp. 'Peltigera malacea cyanobiont' DB3992]